MPPKKAAAAKANDEEDVSCDNFYKFYRKNCTTLEVPVAGSIKQMFEEYVEEGTPISRIHSWEMLGWQGTKAIIDAMMQVEYRHCASIRLWKGKCEDQGARLISEYVKRFHNCTILELLDCQITPHGCEFLNAAFIPRASALQMIKLDHNPLGSEGINILAQGLGRNSTVELLSLSYCDIGADGAQGLFEILIFQNSKMLELNLQGNPLENEGIIPVFQGLAAAKTLQMVTIADCQFDDSEDVLEAMKFAMTSNETLGKYDMGHNIISEEGVEEVCEILGEAKHVQQLTLTEFISEDATNMLQEALAANKPTKGKKGKKKK